MEKVRGAAKGGIRKQSRKVAVSGRIRVRKRCAVVGFQIRRLPEAKFLIGEPWVNLMGAETLGYGTMGRRRLDWERSIPE